MQKATLVWVDANGITSATNIGTGTGLGAALPALVALCNAAVQQYWEGTVNVPGTFPTAAPFQSGADRAVLTFVTAAGTQVAVVAPAPSSGIFLPDAETVDITNPFVASFVAAAIAAPITDGAGNAVTALISGIRTRRTGTVQ